MLFETSFSIVKNVLFSVIIRLFMMSSCYSLCLQFINQLIKALFNLSNYDLLYYNPQDTEIGKLPIYKHTTMRKQFSH